MLTECRVIGQWPTIEAMALVRPLELEARVRRVKEYNENDLRDAARDVLMITGTGAALAERGRRKRAWLDAFDRSTLVSGDPSDAIEWFRSLFGSHAAEPEEVLARRHG